MTDRVRKRWDRNDTWLRLRDLPRDSSRSALGSCARKSGRVPAPSWTSNKTPKYTAGRAP